MSVGAFELTMDDLPILHEALLPVATEWYNIGLHMGIPVHELDAIEADHFHEGAKTCLRKVLMIWLKGLGGQAPSWPNLIAVLRNKIISRYRLAAELEQKHCPQPRGPQVQVQADAATASITPNEAFNLENAPERKWLEIGTKARVKKGKELGHGAYGYVCEMLDETGAELCLGKYFHPGMIRDKHFGTKFKKETQLLATLSHPNIIEIIGSLTPEDGGDYCLLMERMDYSLHDYVCEKTQDQLPLSEKLSILQDVANGLSYLHSRSPTIIHRDLTAHNVLLTADDPPIAKIADFGNCRLVGFETNLQVQSLMEKPGTSHYMAPEACEELACYNTKLDIYSFGHLALFTITQSPISSLLKKVEKGPDGRYIGRTEIDRRQDHFKKLNLPSTHPAVIMMKECLNEEPEDRPDACTLVTHLEEMRKTPPIQETNFPPVTAMVGVAEGVGALSLGGREACRSDVPEPSTSDPSHGWVSDIMHFH